MLLAIDCGNTNTVFSIWDGERFIFSGRTSTEWQRTADQYYVWLSSLMQFQGVDVEITEVIVSSTVPRVVFNLRVFSDRYFNCRPLVVGKDGAYIGGVIAPGVNLSLEALHNAAAALPHVDITKPQGVIGTNTIACMQSGVFWGYIGLIKEISARIKAERGREMKVISTGGLAPLFQQSETIFDEFNDDLTMHGLVVINSYNRKQK